MNRTLLDYTPETEIPDAETVGDDTSLDSGRSGSVFSETEELEFAAEFLEVQSEHDLDRFLGKLISRTGTAAGTTVRSPIGQALGGVLKHAARQALPLAGRAISGYVGSSTGPQVLDTGTAAAGRLFGLELEGLSPEDKEFEIARSFVRFSEDTIRSAVTAQSPAPPMVLAQLAAGQAASRYAPGLLRSAPPTISGRWIRRGRNIVVVNS